MPCSSWWLRCCVFCLGRLYQCRLRRCFVGFGDFNAFERGVIRQLSGCLGMRQGLPVSALSAVGFWSFVVGDVQEGRASALRGADLLPGWGSVSRAGSAKYSDGIRWELPFVVCMWARVPPDGSMHAT